MVRAEVGLLTQGVYIEVLTREVILAHKGNIDFATFLVH